MDPVSVLQIALVALKTARDAVPKIVAHKDRAIVLIDRCERLTVDVCAQVRPGSPMPLDRHLKVLESACISVRDAVMNLSGRNQMWRFFNKDEIDEAFKAAEGQLTDASAMFNVGANVTPTRLQDDLRQALRQDRQQFLVYLEALLKEFQRTVATIEALSPQPVAGPSTDVSRAFLSTSWRVGPQEVVPVEDSILLPDGAIGKVRRGRMGGKVVAVKHIHGNVARVLLGSRNSSKNFEEKVKKWITLSHPHVGQFIGACFEAQQPFLVIEYAPYRNVMDYTQNRPESNLTSILHQISAGMMYLHENEIIHANLKPANILVRADHTVVVHDYELLLLKDYATLSRSVNNYMAPEYIDGDTDYPADVYSFAMSTWEIYTGHMPFSDIPPHELRGYINMHRPGRPEDMDEVLWMWLQQWWNPHSSHRTAFLQIEAILRKMMEPDATPSSLGMENLKLQPNRHNYSYAGPGDNSLGLKFGHQTSNQSFGQPSNRLFDSYSRRSPSQSPDSSSYVPISSSIFPESDYDMVTLLSNEGREAISRVTYALTQLAPFDKLAADILSAYPDWFKFSEIRSSARSRRTGYQEGAAKAISTLGKTTAKWVDTVPWLKGASVSDRRRTVIFIAVICIMAEDAFRLKVKAPYREVHSFIEDKLARSDFKAFLERNAQRIGAQQQSQPQRRSALASELVWIVERGCHLLYSPPEDYR